MAVTLLSEDLKFFSDIRVRKFQCERLKS